MTLHRSVLCALVMLVAMPAEAGVNVFWKFNAPDVTGSSKSSLTIKTPNGKTIVKSIVRGRISSDAGSEDVTFTESDAYLHGAAEIGALPKTDATLTLTLYDKGSASLMSFSGALGTDGAVTLTADETKDSGDSTACALKTGCTDAETDTSAASLDIEVLAGEVFGASGSYELGLDLAGADTYEVAYAAITVTESTEVTTCTKGGGCTTTGSSTTTKGEVDWDEIGAVWEAELSVEPEGVIEVKVKTYDADGEEVENTKVALGVPWLDGGEGINVLGLDEDPLTGMSVISRNNRAYGAGKYGMELGNAWLVVNSSGWTATTVPVAAKVELTDGDTITIPVNSYQRGGLFQQDFIDGVVASSSSISISGGSILLSDHSVVSMTDSPICVSGGCFMLVENEDEAGSYALSVSVHGTDATKLPDDLDLTVTITDSAGDEVYSETDTVEFDDEITAVFANEISFSEDAIGLDLSGEVSLLGAADKKGKQKTLAKGNFYGGFSRDGDGDLALAGADKNAGTSRGDVVVGGDPIEFGLQTDENGNAVYVPPPLTPVFGNGSGTKNAAHQASTKPELL